MRLRVRALKRENANEVRHYVSEEFRIRAEENGETKIIRGAVPSKNHGQLQRGVMDGITKGSRISVRGCRGGATHQFEAKR